MNSVASQSVGDDELREAHGSDNVLQTESIDVRKYLALVLALVIGIAAAGCDAEESGDTDEQAESVEADDEPAADDGDEQTEEDDGADESGADEGDSEGLADIDADFDYPGFDLDELDEDQRMSLAETAFVELCPCEDSQESLHECMQQDERCEEADEEAAALVDVVSDSTDEQEAAERRAEQRAEAGQDQEFDLEGAPHKGDPNADVIIVEFADFGCPHCRDAAAAIDVVHERFGDDVGIFFKHFPGTGPVAEQAAHAAMAAAEQDRFWEMHGLIFENQRNIDRGQLEQFSRRLGLNHERFQEDMNSQEITGHVAGDRQEGMQAGVTGTPTIFINGERYTGRLSGDALAARVGSELEE